MLSHMRSSAMLAVSDMHRARAFYPPTLGLSAVDDTGDVAVYRTGPTHLLVYRSDEAGTNRANAVVFDAGGEIEATVADLATKGVAFKRYQMDGTTYRNGIQEAGGMKMV